MRIAVLGTGIVGRTLATRFAGLHHRVVLGSRDPGGDRAQRWARSAGSHGKVAGYAEAVTDATVVVNAIAGAASPHALGELRTALENKVLVDVANPVATIDSDPPVLEPVNELSLGERLQLLLPRTHVVKTLNTVSPAVMIHPTRVPGHHVVFLAGNNGHAKRVVTGLLRELGWPPDGIVDLGDITGARSTEMLVPLRHRLSRSFGHTDFNLDIQHGRTRT
ncbi:NADP oxidoreductase [Amycolatopsis rhizosphaerae]|uniref:NADP oxidoreductase n=1 Tax=Amycolatopsis rhizosphaerae TaxID=2053003 RepID=A0A558DAW9_9PSEU|nr:NAD(P)-binding domain-containing protein [Amycolatopsis rhizosphaerae]TVT58151.1 NADP oxidoreductase [Amycolatopsis rhizosphaerae]